MLADITVMSYEENVPLYDRRGASKLHHRYTTRVPLDLFEVLRVGLGGVRKKL